MECNASSVFIVDIKILTYIAGSGGLCVSWMSCGIA